MDKPDPRESPQTGSTSSTSRDDEAQQAHVAAGTKNLDPAQPTRTDKPTRTLHDDETLRADVTEPAKVFPGPPPTRADKATPAPESPGLPLMLGGYRIIRKLGEGGMGVVYEAEQQHPRRPVALKVIRGGHFVDEYHVKLFEREAQALARLKHPGIAAIYEAGVTDGGQHFFAMELVQGVPLMDYVKGRNSHGIRAPSDVKEWLELFLKICDAINYAHQRGVIHRDLKPTNILVTEQSEGQSTSSSLMGGPEVKILDFGLARITDPDAAITTMVSEVGQIKGTLPYMSPEQVRGNPNEIDVRSDVYSLGVILYELLTDQLPYEVHRTSLPEAIRAICEEPPKSPSRVVSKTLSHAGTKPRRIDRDVETIVLKALEKDPEQRYQSAAALAEDVERYLTNQPILARPPSAMYQFRKLVARHKAPFAFVVALFVLLLGFALTMWRQSARIAHERARAVAAERLAAEQRDAAERALTRTEEAEKRAIAEAEHARAAKVLTEQKTVEALAATQESNRQRTKAQRQSYKANLIAAESSLQVNEVAEARRRLAACEPSQRNWEWHHLYVRSDSSLATFRGHDDQIISVAFSPDGARIISGSDDKTVHVWDAISFEPLLTPRGHDAPVTSVAFSPDGAQIVSGSADKTVRVWKSKSAYDPANVR